MGAPLHSPPHDASKPEDLAPKFLTARIKGYAGGLLIAGFGALGIWEGMRHPSGTLTAMGPGFLPMVIGVILVGLAIAVSLESRLIDRAEVGETALPSLRAALAIFSALVAFGYVVGRFGVVPATYALVILSAFAQSRPKLPTAVGVATVLSLIAVVVFIQGFGIPMRAFRW